MRTAHRGVSDAGFSTTQLPATSAGIIFQQGIATGKFQGVMSPATPSGSRMLIAHLSGSSDGTVSPKSRLPSPAMRKAMSMPSWTSPRASAMTLPISALIACATRSLFSARMRAERVEELTSTRRGRRPPGGIGGARRGDGRRDVGRDRRLEAPDERAGRGIA